MRVVFLYNLQRTPSEEEAEFNTPATVAAITAGLVNLGHEVTPLEAGAPLAEIVRRLAEIQPDLVFNTAEGARGRFREGLYPAVLEAMGIPFTGSDAYVCTLTLDKHLTKLVVAESGVPVPQGRLVRELAELDTFELPFPVIVKPAFEGSSMGINQRSVVEDPAELRSRVAERLAQYPAGLLIEEFISGIDLVVPFLESVPGGLLELGGYRIAPEAQSTRRYAIYDLALKTTESDAVDVIVPAPVPPEVRTEAMRICALAYRALGIRDLARIDLRLGDDGKLRFIECNALPSLELGAAFYASAALAGLDTMELVLDAIIRGVIPTAGELL